MAGDKRFTSNKKTTSDRRATYEAKREEAQKPCAKCTMRNPERCTWCTFGRRLRALEAEYSDVTGWSHSKW